MHILAMHHNKPHSLGLFLLALTIPLTLSIFSVHGILSLMYHTPSFTALFILPFAIILLTIVFILNDLKKKYEFGVIKQRKALILCALIIPTSFQIVSQVIPEFRRGEVEPQLMWTHRIGTNNVSDMAVVFWNSTPSINEFEWGNENDSWNVFEYEKTQSHVFPLENLTLNTTYWYSVNQGERQYFSTPNPENFTMGMVGDFHFGSRNRDEENCNSIIKNMDVDTFFSLGDFVHYGFMDSHWKKGFEKLNSITRNTPTKYLIGNHDAMMNGIRLYHDYCYPELMPTDYSRNYGKIVIGNITIFALQIEWDAREYIGEQRIWFENEIKKTNPNDIVIVLTHAPIISSTYREFGEAYFDLPNMVGYFPSLFEEYGVDLVFSGHQHIFEHLEQNGVHYNTLGVGSGYGEVFPETIINSSLWIRDASAGYGKITIQEKNVVVDFVNATSVLHSYSI